MKRQHIVIGILAGTLIAASCKKTKDDGGEAPQLQSTPATGTRLEFSLDTLFLYASQTYLWYDALPAYTSFNARQYTSAGSDLQSLKRELFALSQYKLNPATGRPFEYSGSSTQAKYSFVEEASSSQGGRLSAVTLEGKGNDLGLELGIGIDGNVYIRYVNPGSPAAAAGLTRACRITRLNNSAVVVNSASLNSALAQSSLPVTVIKPDKTELTVTLQKTSYTSVPVLKTAVFTSGSKKIGYISFARFSVLSNSENALRSAFTTFANEGVTDMVVDLRYNGGGYVSTAELFANLLAPSSANGAVMYKETFNTLMQQKKATILKYLPYLDNDGKLVMVGDRPGTYFDVDYSVSGNTRKFSRQGNLSTLSNVVFIVSGNTASASELLLNSLKPYVPVKLVGSKTYGKPVGFFAINIDKYKVYMSQFTSVNARDEGDYFDGITPDISATDDVRYDFGDPKEVCLSKALSFITNGAIPANNGRTGGTEEFSAEPTRQSEFNGMVEDRTRLR